MVALVHMHSATPGHVIRDVLTEGPRYQGAVFVEVATVDGVALEVPFSDISFHMIGSPHKYWRQAGIAITRNFYIRSWSHFKDPFLKTPFTFSWSALMKTVQWKLFSLAMSSFVIS